MKKLLILASLPVIALIIGFLPASVSASNASQQQACSGVQELGEGATCSNPQAATSSVDNLVMTVINLLSFIVGIASVIVLVVAGFRIVTSGGGDSGSVSSARSQILYAVIGLIVVAIAQIITRIALHTAGKVG